jgi:hypothetical protein
MRIGIDRVTYRISTSREEKKKESTKQREKLIKLGVHPDLLSSLDDEQVSELLYALLYLMVRRQVSYA